MEGIAASLAETKVAKRSGIFSNSLQTSRNSLQNVVLLSKEIIPLAI